MPFGFLGKLAGSIGGGIKSGGTFNEMASIEWRPGGAIILKPVEVEQSKTEAKPEAKKN